MQDGVWTYMIRVIWVATGFFRLIFPLIDDTLLDVLNLSKLMIKYLMSSHPYYRGTNVFCKWARTNCASDGFQAASPKSKSCSARTGKFYIKILLLGRVASKPDRSILNQLF